MKEQIYRLCKRMKKCTLDNLVQMLETDKAIIETALLYLEQENKVQVRDGVIFANSRGFKTESIAKKSLFLMLQYSPQEKVELIMRCFCLSIPADTVSHLVDLGSQTVADYYTIFRKQIYERQFRQLLGYFKRSPQTGRYRIFFEKYAYFYIYNNELFVSEKLLKNQIEQSFNTKEISEFKKLYSYLSRLESHNKNDVYMYYRLAEYLWRRNKNFNELYADLNNLLFS